MDIRAGVRRKLLHHRNPVTEERILHAQDTGEIPAVPFVLPLGGTDLLVGRTDQLSREPIVEPGDVADLRLDFCLTGRGFIPVGIGGLAANGVVERFPVFVGHIVVGEIKIFFECDNIVPPISDVLPLIESSAQAFPFFLIGGAAVIGVFAQQPHDIPFKIAVQRE